MPKDDWPDCHEYVAETITPAGQGRRTNDNF